MTVARKRREMTEAEMISLVPACADDLARDAFDLQNTLPNLPENYFHKGYAAGWCKVFNVCVAGVPQYRLYFETLNGSGRLHVMASLFIGNKPDPDAWAKGAEILARQFGFKKIVFTTARKGHVIQAQSWGATVTAVVMEKNLC